MQSVLKLSRRSVLAGAAATAGAMSLVGMASAQETDTLRVVMSTDLRIVDPIWATAYIIRDHGYMIYDTLFALDANGEIKPQMVDTYSVSDDKLRSSHRWSTATRSATTS